MNNPLHDDSRSPDDLNLAAADREMESILSRLRPATAGLNTPTVLFAAGRAAGLADAQRAARRSRTKWQAVAAVLALTTTISIAGNLRQMSYGPVDLVMQASPAPTTVRVDEKHPPTVDKPLSPSLPHGSMLALRTAVLADGVEGLPHQSFGTANPAMRLADLRP